MKITSIVTATILSGKQELRNLYVSYLRDSDNVDVWVAHTVTLAEPLLHVDWNELIGLHPELSAIEFVDGRHLIRFHEERNSWEEESD